MGAISSHRSAFQPQQSEEKCTVVQERLDLAEKKLAQFSEKPVTAVEECLAQGQIKEFGYNTVSEVLSIRVDCQRAFPIMVDETNDDALDINSLHDEIILEIFGYLTQNQLGQIARVCRRWNVLTKSPLLWKKVNVKIFVPSYGSEIITVKSFINGLPSCVNSIRLDFIKYKKTFHFYEFFKTLEERFSHLEELMLTNSEISHSLHAVIFFCSLGLKDLKYLIFHHCKFSRDYGHTDEYSHISKLEILELFNCCFDCSTNSPFSKMPHMKEVHLFDTNVDNSWFENDTSFLNQLHVLNLGFTCITASAFSEIFNHGQNLKELYLCSVELQSNDLNLNYAVFHHLQIICLADTGVTCQGVVSLIQSCPSLQTVYVNGNVAESFSAHPFVVANRWKSGIVKAVDWIHNHNVGHSHN